MAKSGAERMTELRERHARDGLVPLSLTVPAQDVGLFRAFAADRRRLHEAARERIAQQHWLSMLPVPAEAPSAAESPRRAGLPSRASRAEALAQTLLERILDMGWPVGRPLGSEGELVREHRVSRAVLRQAKRLLVHHSVARTVRGSGGGLVVAEPDLGATMRAVSLYLEYRGIRPADIVHTRLALETATITRAVAVLAEDGERRLREAVSREAAMGADASAEDLQSFHLLIADLCGDPALALFARIVLRLAEAHSTFAERPWQDRMRVVHRIRRLHAAIADAMLARDGPRAVEMLRRYLDGYPDWMKQRQARAV